MNFLLRLYSDEALGDKDVVCPQFHMSLLKSKHRVANDWEVFAPAWMVEAMLDFVKGETERIDSRFLV